MGDLVVYVLTCNNTLGTCCSDVGLVSLINIIKTFIEIIQVIVPIILIVSASIQLMTMMMNPDDPKEIKKRTLYNKFIAAVIVFLLPVMVNLILLATAEGVNGAKEVEVLACFKAAKNHKLSNETVTSYKPRSNHKDKTKVVVNKQFDNGYTGPPISKDSVSDNSSSKDSSSSNTGSNNTPVNENVGDVVAYAKQFLGYPYVWGGNDPHTGSDCSGFVVYIYNKFSKSGHKISRASLPNFGGGSGSANFTKIAPGSAAAGDLVVYSGHYAMLTGNGKQIIHASNKKDGVKLSPSYAYKSIIGIYRYKYLK